MNDYVLLSLFSVPLSSNTSFPVVNVSEYLASLEGVQDIPEISHTAEVTVFNREDTDAAAATRQNSDTQTQEGSLGNEAITGDGVRKATASTTVHENPDWLQDLIFNFKEYIVDDLSKPTRDAFGSNQLNFNSEAQEAKVRMEIKNSIVDHLVTIFGGNGAPKIAQVRKIVQELQFVYPAMFKEEKGKKMRTGWKFGGSSGPDGLAKQILSAIQKKDKRSEVRKRLNSGDSGDSSTSDSLDGLPSKKKKMKPVFGVNTDKYYVTKVSEEAKEALKELSNVEKNCEERESVFEKYRSDLQAFFLNAKVAIPNQVPAFFQSPKHLQSHFLYLTGASESLDDKIEKSYSKQIDILERVLRCSYDDEDLSKTISDAEIRCVENYRASEMFKDITIFREAAAKMSGSEKGRSAFIRLMEDRDPIATSPHILGYYDGEDWRFDIYVDKLPALRGLNMTDALASFLHLCFVFNLQYPKVINC